MRAAEEAPSSPRGLTRATGDRQGEGDGACKHAPYAWVYRARGGSNADHTAWARRLLLDGFDPRQIRPRPPSQARPDLQASAPVESPLPAGLRPSAIGPGKGPPDLCYRVLWCGRGPSPGNGLVGRLSRCPARSLRIGRSRLKSVHWTDFTPAAPGSPPYPALRLRFGRSDLKTVHWTVFAPALPGPVLTPSSDTCSQALPRSARHSAPRPCGGCRTHTTARCRCRWCCPGGCG